MIKLVEDPDEFTQEPREDNVIHLLMPSSMPGDPDHVLKAAMGVLDGVIVIGYVKGDKNNRSANDEYFASSIAAGDTALWLLERCKHKLLQIADAPWMEDDNNETG